MLLIGVLMCPLQLAKLTISQDEETFLNSVFDSIQY
jgi:hypothetical protein